MVHRQTEFGPGGRRPGRTPADTTSVHIRRSLHLRFSAATRAVLVVGLAWLAVPVTAQEAADPREPKPERPTVATHAYAVAAGIVELETGIQWQRPTPDSAQLAGPTLFKVGLGRRVQLDIAPGWVWLGPNGARQGGFSDAVVGIKWQVADGLPILADLAIQPTLKLPTGSLERATGTGTTDLNVLLISSRSIGPVSIDINVGYTRRSGDGSNAPTGATMWTVSTGFPVVGGLAWAAEIFGYPGTSGPAGSGPIVAFLTGPTFAAKRSLVLDGGLILSVTGFGGTAVYVGATWNIGRLPGAYKPLPPKG
jgi:hypothetical protein